jgi:hypothetical protein
VIVSQPDLAKRGKADAAAAGPAQKQKLNVYTVMLVVAFLCIVTACILLYQEITRWGKYPWWETNEGKPNVQTSSLVVPAAQVGNTIREAA